jgi:hypothetical protein
VPDDVPRVARALLAAAVLGLPAGCSRGDRVPLHPASGQVLVGGQPAPGVEVRLVPADRPDNPDALRPFARTGDDGRFRLGTYDPEDGAPEGRYKVTLFWSERPPGPEPPKDRLGGRYASPEKTDLEVTIRRGDNRLDPFRVEQASAPPAGRTKRPPTRRNDFDGTTLPRAPRRGFRPMLAQLAFALTLATNAAGAPGDLPLIRSAGSGAWSDASTWEGGRVPGAGARVQVREGHRVLYDRDSDAAIRFIHVAGTLEFARDRDTRLEVGLIKVQPGDDANEDGFTCDAHVPEPEPGKPRPALLVGRPGAPIPAEHTATIRLRHFDGMDPETCPGLIACGGRIELHGAPLRRTWTKLAREAYRNEPIVLLKRADVAGWKPGDRVILTGTARQFGYKQTRTVSVAERPSTEERTVEDIKPYVEGELALVTLDRPLEFDHRAEGDYRGEVANLSRNVVVESANPDGVRGHTMYHRNSAGSVHYAELRHLGKEGVLGKYSLHFHLAGETMRGSSVVGASIWDSKNRWITIHGTSYLVVRDCVGYKSVGHGFFLEDGTETRNVLDGNLAVMALRSKPLPEQVLPFDGNLGSGFWWANSLNAFTNNVAAECDQDGFRFEVVARDDFDPVLPVLQADGTRESVDIRTLPFLRFDDNEAHCQRFFGLNLGGFNDGGVPGYGGARDRKVEDVDGVGPDPAHPFRIRRFRAWDTQWAFHGGSPSVLVEGMDLHDSQYGLWRSVMAHHEYRDLKMTEIISSPVFYPRPGRGDTGEIAFLRPADDLPPATVITEALPAASPGRVLVRGSACDDGEIVRVVVNGREARPLRPGFAEWEIELEAAPDATIEAGAVDAAGHVEATPHRLRLPDLRSYGDPSN